MFFIEEKQFQEKKFYPDNHFNDSFLIFQIFFNHTIKIKT